MLKRLTRSNTTTSPDKIHVFKPGSYVWAKMDRKFWPGIIVSHRDIGMETAETGKCWVFWFGDHRVSNVSCKILKDFCQEYFRYITIPEMYCKKWVQGISECLREIGLPDTQTLSIPDLKTWAKSNLENAYLTKYFVTNFVKSKLDKIRSENLKPANDEYDTFASRCIPSMESTMETEFSVALPVEVSNVEDNIDSVKECANHIVRQIIADYNMGKISTLRICMGCYSDKISDEHPIFNGYFCTDCNKRFKKTYCKIVPNLKKEYCTVCGFAGDMLVCMNIKCKFVYCTICIQDLAEVDAYAVLSKKKKWFCFLCAPNRTCRGVLVPRDGWEDNENMIVPTQKQVLFSNKYSNQSSAFKDKEKKERRSSNIKLILSIIETFKNKSGFHYSGNSNECIEITKSNYPEMMQLLTSRKAPKENLFQNVMPINVLICDQRSRSENICPTKIMCEFYQLIKCLNQIQDDPCYWIFEWSKNIDVCQRVNVTRFLKEYPVSHLEQRLIWCNFPLDTENIDLCFRNILFTEPFCYKEQPKISNFNGDTTK